jgi:hypothetical protein
LNDTIKVDIREIGCEDVDWIRLAEDRDQWWVFMYTVMHLWVHIDFQYMEH